MIVKALSMISLNCETWGGSENSVIFREVASVWSLGHLGCVLTAGKYVTRAKQRAWSLAWEHTGDRGCSEAVLLSIPLATVFQGNVKETEF